MAASNSVTPTFQIDITAETQVELSYTNRSYQVSNIIIQDPNKEGILRYFENINYNSINKTTQETSQPSSTPSSTMPGGQSSGTY